ncbi:hypothetical protein JHL18_03500 [Clostridium sp. YIM B02505]|uniref:Uncharacterized protein n=1 Tax=Clostridium yunnanense TaxID=2800325 RepID=A0ABS1EK13_9CLOT|nr:hypothetical protein [Clostridium yunnanense]MBK1809704.1 hypothetical protein [Clostridium yunnanense]
MDKWEISRYLIDAKKSVDTILYLYKYGDKVSMINIREKVRETRRKFYINGCIVLDKCFHKTKKQICENEIIKSIYYERDKDAAHKDDKYMKKQYSSLMEMAEDMKIQVQSIREVCKDFLPDNLTLDFLVFDSELFRLANGVDKEMETKIWNAKFPSNNSGKDVVEGERFNMFSDTEDIKQIAEAEKKKYATVLSCGICMEETMQSLQDGCIKTNVLYKQDMWVSISQESLNAIFRLRELGFIDKFDLPREPRNKAEEKALIKILEKEGLL